VILRRIRWFDPGAGLFPAAQGSFPYRLCRWWISGACRVLVIDRFVHMSVDMFIDVFAGMKMGMVFIVPVAVHMYHPFVQMPVDMPLPHEK
jgi:hypothetical protein